MHARQSHIVIEKITGDRWVSGLNRYFVCTNWEEKGFPSWQFFRNWIELLSKPLSKECLLLCLPYENILIFPVAPDRNTYAKILLRILIESPILRLPQRPLQRRLGASRIHELTSDHWTRWSLMLHSDFHQREKLMVGECHTAYEKCKPSWVSSPGLSTNLITMSFTGPTEPPSDGLQVCWHFILIPELLISISSKEN